MGVALLAPTGNFLPTVLIAIMGPYPMSYGNDGRTTLDDTLEMGAAYGAASFVFIPDLISEEDKTSGIKGSRLVGHTAMRNMGIKMALENGYDYLFLVENDVKFRPETLNRLLAHGEELILPRLTFPAFDPVEWLCYGPREEHLVGGLLELNWAAHCAILFSSDALKKIGDPVFKGLVAEGHDHDYWRNQGVHAQMDLDTPVEVLALANGHRAMYEIPFKVHYSKGEICEGPVYLEREGRHVRIYGCRAEGCSYEMTALAPQATNSKESHDYHVLAQLSLERDYWADRAPYYRNLDWVKDKGYLDSVINVGRLESNDFVLDAGAGSGAIAFKVADSVKEVVALDFSDDMMDLAGPSQREGWESNLNFKNGDIRALPYPKFFFSKVFARMVLHGLTDEGDIEQAVRECYRVLLHDGRFIVSEGVPTSPKIATWYTAVFKHKENRLTLDEDYIKELLADVYFKDIEVSTHIIEQSSVRNWLDNSALKPDKAAYIMGRYREMPAYVRKGYNATFTDEGDVLIDLKFLTVSGVK